MASNPWAEGIEAIVFRTVNDQATLWELILPAELLVLPAELSRVDALLDDAVFYAPFAAYFDARIGRPSIPMETYVRLMFLKFRYRLGYEALCREVADSISWQRFARIPFGTRVPHPTTLMKITTRCGDTAVTALNEALLAKAATAKLLRTDKVRADTTVVEADVAYPTDSGLLAKAIGKIARTTSRVKAAGGATRTRSQDRRRAAGRRARSIASKLRLRGAQQRDETQATVRRITGELAGLAEAAIRDADAIVRNAKRALRRATGQQKGRLHRALGELNTTLQRTARAVEQTRIRLGGEVPDGATRLVSLHDPDARPTHPNSPRRSPGSPAAPGAHRARSPPTAATAKPASNATCMPSACAPSPSPARTNPPRPAASSSTAEPSATRSNGGPGQKDGSTTSNAATAGTAPNSPPSRAPEPGADTASSPTTWSRSGHWQHEQPDQAQPRQPHPEPIAADRASAQITHADARFCRSK